MVELPTLKDAAGTANLLCALFEVCKCEHFIEEVQGDDPDLASYLRIEERELEAGGCELDGRHPLRLTVTLNDAFPVFPLVSVAEHLTTVRPIGNRLPERGAQVTGT